MPTEETKKKITLKDLGFSFTFDPNCTTCGEGQCHNVVKCNIEEQDCWVHLTADPACGTYVVFIQNFETFNSPGEWICTMICRENNGFAGQ